ncbi:uncharacterized protein LOC110414141 [Herrania umbratica]|uniref:Uncharacterized protein LOC110414141 n=1 Tax=Herrania umbratica TaxID=108875 RepID=A0A6J1A171_9ROSI|nr:uncharacterized protein LOC110414141 [Herrania umbratica]
MGNCVFKGFGEVEEMVKVVTSSGGIMELFAPITAECITNEFPGHAIYRTRDLFSQPLLHNEELHAGELYYLLPLNNSFTKQNNQNINSHQDDDSKIGNNIISSSSSSVTTPYRMSFDHQRVLKRSEAEVLPRYNNSGVWKVKLVISPDQLADILAQEARTEALIESVRTVAKCGNGVSSVANSDQWSVSSSWKGSLGKCAEDRW